MNISFDKFKNLLEESYFVINNGMICEYELEFDRISIYYQNEPSARPIEVFKDSKIIFEDNCFKITGFVGQIYRVYLVDLKKID